MRLSIAAIGRMKAGPERELAARYLDRLAKAGPALGLEWAGLAESPESRASDASTRKQEETGKLTVAFADGAARVVLDETGHLLTSTEFAAYLARHRDEGRRDMAFVIGGPDGHAAAMLDGADLKLSLGRMTFPHQIARVLLAEQLYRAATILSGHPYHRQ